MPDLKDIRRRLDLVDRRIVDALAERQAIVQDVARFKAQHAKTLRDTPRERDVLTKVADLASEAGIDRQFVVRVYREIMEHSLRRQHAWLSEQQGAPDRVVVAFQGTAGSYSWLASSRFFASHSATAELRGYDTFRHILDAVRDGAADFAVLPIENTTAGSINEAYDLLARTDLVIVGEEVHPIVHCLLAPEPVPIGQIRKVYSQAPALAQCTDFIDRLADCTAVSWTDTARSCEKVKGDGDPTQAAIASAEAGELYGLHVLARDIANQRENHTRWVVVARQPLAYDARIPCKTSVVFATRHEEGALVACLNVLAQHGLNLTKLESRPRPHTPWEYLFYVDFEGNAADPEAAAALDAMARHTRHLKVLGSYPARNTADAAPAQPLPTRTAPRPQLGRSAHPLASRDHRQDDTVVRLGPVAFGTGEPVLIAGPGQVRSEAQIRAIGQAVRTAGGHVLRGGCFKAASGGAPTGVEGLRWLAAAGAAVELPVMTEVTDASQVADAAAHADILQVGARGMADYALLDAAGSCQRPVLLKRAELASLDEWLAAAERILASGNQQVILCERGIRAAGTRVTLDLGAIPALAERTHLPVVVDPCHAVDAGSLLPMSRAALAAGAAGLLLRVEVGEVEGPTSLDAQEWAAFAAGLAQ